jgi:hypothetical protein
VKEALQNPTPEEKAEMGQAAFRMGIGEEGLPDEEPETGPRYPLLRFPTHAIPQSGILYKMTKKACEGGLSPGLVVPSILTLVSAVPVADEMAHARINQYTTLFAMVGAGKDTAIGRALQVTGLEDEGDIVTAYSPSGERSISTLIGDQPAPKGADMERIPGPNSHCIVTYELEDTLNKSKGETSSVLQALQWLYDHNKKTYADSKTRHKLNVDCRLSWLTALPVGQGEIDESEYSRAFGESALHGLASRMIFGFAEGSFDRRKSRKWSVDWAFTHPVSESTTEDHLGMGSLTVETVKSYKELWHGHKVKDFAQGVEEQYLAWQPQGGDASGRDSYHILKIAAACALVELHEYIEQSDWDFAKAFMEWQRQIRLAFEPSRSKRITQGEFNERVMKEMKKRTEKVKQSGRDTKNACRMEVGRKTLYFVRWKSMANDGRWHLFGLDTKRTIQGLVDSGQLAYKPNLTEEERNADEGERHDQNWIRLEH